MSAAIIDRGKSNRIVIPDASEAFSGRIEIVGDNNEIIVGRGSTARSVDIHCVSGTTIHVGDNVNLADTNIHLLAPCKLVIGEFTSFVGGASIAAHESADITIGHECLIAGGVSFSVSDMHSIIDIASGERINRARPILLENRVWLGAGCRVMKGAVIRTGSIVGAGSIVTGLIPPDSLAAGIPARIIRHGVTWRGDLI